MLRKKLNIIFEALFIMVVSSYQALADSADSSGVDDPLATSRDFSDRMLGVIQGPVLKLLAAIVLLVGVAGLLRGRNKLAISCGLGFLILLFLPILVGHIKG